MVETQLRNHDPFAPFNIVAESPGARLLNGTYDVVLYVPGCIFLFTEFVWKQRKKGQ